MIFIIILNKLKGVIFIRKEVLNDIISAIKSYNERDPTYKALIIFILDELESCIIGYYNNLQLKYLFTMLKDSYYLMELYNTITKRKEKNK